MEQLIDTFGIDWRILLIQMANFGILAGLLWYVLYKPIVKLIEDRRAQIIKGVADAERAEAALKDADAKKTDIVASASIEAEKIIASSRTAGKEKEADIVEKAQEKYDRMLVEAQMKSEEIKRSALDESKEEIARLIVLGVEKTLKSEGNNS
jgi:F-type H+-transporting ATPase subunit b